MKVFYILLANALAESGSGEEASLEQVHKLECYKHVNFKMHYGVLEHERDAYIDRAILDPVDDVDFEYEEREDGPSIETCPDSKNYECFSTVELFDMDDASKHVRKMLASMLSWGMYYFGPGYLL